MMVGLGATVKGGLVKLLKSDSITKGIAVTLNNNKLTLDFHVIVAYGADCSGCGRHGRVCTGLGKKERNLSAGSGRCIKSCRMEGSEHRALHPFRKQGNFRQYERRN